MHSSSQDRNVLQFHAGAGVPQHKSAPAHVPASDEIDGKQKTLAENFKKWSRVFSTRNAAEQHIRTIARVGVQKIRTLHQRISKGSIFFRNRDLGDRLELLHSHYRFRRDKSCTWNNDEGRRKTWRSGSEPLRVNHLAAEVQAANEAVDFADGG